MFSSILLSLTWLSDKLRMLFKGMPMMPTNLLGMTLTRGASRPDLQIRTTASMTISHGTLCRRFFARSSALTGKDYSLQDYSISDNNGHHALLRYLIQRNLLSFGCRRDKVGIVFVYAVGVSPRDVEHPTGIQVHPTAQPPQRAWRAGTGQPRHGSDPVTAAVARRVCHAPW